MARKINLIIESIKYSLVLPGPGEEPMKFNTDKILITLRRGVRFVVYKKIYCTLMGFILST